MNMNTKTRSEEKSRGIAPMEHDAGKVAEMAGGA